jgi:hypothetical protein
MVSAYISYRNQPSLDLAQLLATKLAEKRIKVYLSPEDKSGSYQKQFPLIEKANVFLCLVAQGTFEPRWVQSEIQHAHSLSKPMIPVYQGDFKPVSSSYPIYQSYPADVQFLLEQEAFTLPAVTNEFIDGLVTRIYAEVGKIPRNQMLIPNQYIFISYSRKDSEIMNQTSKDLRQNGLNVWIDEDDLEAGTAAWEHGIGDAIRQCGCVVAILSPDAEQSIWVGRELAMAEALNKRIFPILVRGTKQDAIPFRLMTHQWIDGRNSYSDALSKLVLSLQKHFADS